MIGIMQQPRRYVRFPASDSQHAQGLLGAHDSYVNPVLHCRAPPRHSQGTPSVPELLLLAWKGTGSKALRFLVLVFSFLV